MRQTETKELILARVFKLLLAKGYDGVSITDIQKETGMARGLLYHYFGGKEQLFIEVTGKYLKELFNINLQRAAGYTIGEMITHTVERYTDIITRSFTAFAADGTITMADYDFLFYRVMRENAQFAADYVRFRERELATWRIVVRNSIMAGELRADVYPDTCAEHFIYLLDGIWMRTVDDNTPEAFQKKIREALTDYYRLLKR